MLLHFINASHANLNARKRMNSNRSYQYNPLNMDFVPHIEESCKIVMSSYGVFKKKAREQVNITLYDYNSPLHSGCTMANKITNNMTRHMIYSFVAVF